MMGGGGDSERTEQEKKHHMGICTVPVVNEAIIWHEECKKKVEVGGVRSCTTFVFRRDMTPVAAIFC